MTLEDRFWPKVNRDGADGCWLWTASLNDAGYGQIYNGAGRPERAHRVAYELLVGPIPPGLHLDHLCRVRHCVNPAHLEPVTIAENNRRAAAAAVPGARRKTHCRNGHAFTPGNTRMDPSGFQRCRTCERAQSLAGYYRRRARQEDVA